MIILLFQQFYHIIGSMLSAGTIQILLAHSGNVMGRPLVLVPKVPIALCRSNITRYFILDHYCSLYTWKIEFWF